ncbi:homeobox domain-containing protein [Phanerochaete sordida]|uniref:Homeobox domain-containing protein n=1 Tax=Phanerochaete sordida TaxID=48140 RepID=A0A9P3FYX5_9APHY|nr:homeobox domain-containing protein [Phanerochaete sordida]
MRPPARATRSSRAADLDEPSVARPAAQLRKTSRPTSSRSSRTGTPYSDKEKKPRHRMTDMQLERLEVLYEQDTHPTREQKQALGEEVGMDTRTVTVWFQNRRQLSKKNSLIVTAAPQLMSRQPLSDTSRRNLPALSRQPSVVSSVSQSSMRVKTPPPHSGALKRELWEYLPSTPSTRTDSAATSTMPSPLARRLSGASGLDKENPPGDPSKRKAILEWACARVAKRQRVNREDEDLDDSDFVEGDASTASDKTLVDIEASEVKPKKVSHEVQPPASLAAVVIPPEYSSKFAPDVVLGASLLLTFQYSLK